MSQTVTEVPEALNAPIEHAEGEVKSYKVPVLLTVVTVVSAIVFVLMRHEGSANFRFDSGIDLFTLPPLDASAFIVPLLAVILMAGIAAYSWVLARRRAKLPLGLTILFGALFLIAFLTWAGAGQSIGVVALLAGTMSLSVPLIFGALGGIISERVGVVNIAIEGQLLAGAFTASVVGTITHSPWSGLLAAAISGMLVSFLLAAFAIKYLVDQVIVGVVLNVLVTGLTSFLYSKLFSGEGTAKYNSPPRFDTFEIPVLSKIPVIGPVLFNQTVVVYLMYLVLIAVYVGLFHTRWGLRLRAVGEHPTAADTVGINVRRTRFWNVALGGAIAGLGGSYYALAALGQFQKEMTAGAGYIALAAVIFGRWDPIRATFAALLFGFATQLQYTLKSIGAPVPGEFMLMLPYVITIIAVAGLVGRVRAPAASGKPYSGSH